MPRVWNQNAILVEDRVLMIAWASGAERRISSPSESTMPLWFERQFEALTHHRFCIRWIPVYGAYDFSNTDGTGKITRMRSSYRMRSITDRTTFLAGDSFSAGPAISTQYPRLYIEDFESFKAPAISMSITEGFVKLRKSEWHLCIFCNAR